MILHTRLPEGHRIKLISKPEGAKIAGDGTRIELKNSADKIDFEASVF